MADRVHVGASIMQAKGHQRGGMKIVKKPRRYNSKKTAPGVTDAVTRNSYDQSLSKINDAETIYLHGR